jgi:RNA polymerase sigma-70 factor, ECF subfamily
LNDAPPLFGNDELDGARRGESGALSAMVIAHRRSVYSLALRMLGTRDLAEDLTQDVFMQLSSHLSSIVSCQHLSFWLRQVTTRKAIDQLRHRSRFVMTALDEEAQIFGTVDPGDPLLQRHLRTLLAQLSPAARAVLLLRYQEDLDPTDIAQTLEMSINTVKSHLKRSLELMRESLHADERSGEDKLR